MKKTDKPIYKVLVLLVVIVIMGVVFGRLFMNDDEYHISVNDKVSSSSVPFITKASITVDIKGEVNNPGVYTIDSSLKLSDAVKEAGGYTEMADTKAINGAQSLYDGMEIVIPSVKGGNITDICEDILNSEYDDK